MKIHLLVPLVCMGFSSSVFSQTESKPINLAERPTLADLVAAGMHTLSSRDKTYDQSEKKNSGVPTQDLAMGRSLYGGPLTLPISGKNETAIEFPANYMTAYFPSEEVSVSDSLFPPTPMVKADSRATSLSFLSTDRKVSDLDSLVKLVEATALESGAFRTWVNEGIWKHAREYKRRFATKFGEVELRIMSDGLVSAEDKLITDARILEDDRIKDSKLRFHITIRWSVPKEEAAKKGDASEALSETPTQRKVFTPHKRRKKLE